MTPRATHPRRAFSLPELLVALGVALVLLAILLPALGSARARAREAQCANNMRLIGAGMLLHEQAYHRLPPAKEEDARTWQLMHALGTDVIPWEDMVLATRACTRENLTCPTLRAESDGPDHQPLGLSYAMNRNYAGAALNATPGQTILAAEVAPRLGLQYVGAEAAGRGLLAFRHGRQANWLFLDGHVQRLPADVAAGRADENWGQDQGQLPIADRPG